MGLQDYLTTVEAAKLHDAAFDRMRQQRPQLRGQELLISEVYNEFYEAFKTLPLDVALAAIGAIAEYRIPRGRLTLVRGGR